MSKYTVPSEIWEVTTGELLGDGHISYDPINAPQRNARLEFTFSAKILHYVNYLKFDVLSFICTNSRVTPWPNTKFTDKEPTQYWFSSKRLSVVSELHSVWYKRVDNKFIKILPLNIEKLLTPVGLAHWIMGDGYYSYGSVILCTDNFTKDEVSNLIKILDEKFSLKASLKKRKNVSNVVWRISISKLSLENLKKLVLPHVIPEMVYKLGIIK